MATNVTVEAIPLVKGTPSEQRHHVTPDAPIDIEEDGVASVTVFSLMQDERFRIRLTYQDINGNSYPQTYDWDWHEPKNAELKQDLLDAMKKADKAAS